MQDTAVIIAAAGLSTRTGGVDKNFALLGGIPVLLRTVLAFEQAESVGQIVIVTRPEKLDEVKKMLSGVKKSWTVTEGGENRQESVRKGLASVGDWEYVAIHDGARPFVSVELIERTVAAAREYGAAVPVIPVADTLKDTEEGRVIATPDRSRLRAAQTPQIFRKSLYLRALAAASGSFTDDSQLVERLGGEVRLVEGDYLNGKLTTAEDMELATLRLSRPRVGFGMDAHRLTEGRKLILCGVEIPCEKGLLGHSDADVAVHALMDALLGAAAMGDIGHLFPDTDDAYLGADSVLLLKEVCDRVRRAGYRIRNADITVVAQAPKLAPYIAEMRKSLAEAMEISPADVNVKATTTEKMGYEGRGEGISANAVCMLQ